MAVSPSVVGRGGGWVAAVFVLVTALAVTACGGGSRAAAPPVDDPEDRAQGDMEILQVPTAIDRSQAVVIDEAAEERDLANNPFAFSWDLQLPSPVHTSWYSADTPQLVYFQLQNGQIYAVNAYSGHTQFVTQALIRTMTLPAHVARTEITIDGQRVVDTRLYAVAGDILYCFDAVYGQLIWRLQLPFEPCSGPYATGLGDNLRVFIGDWEGRIRVISYNDEYQRPFYSWQWNLHEVPTAQPNGHEGIIYVTDHAGHLTGFYLDREQVFQFDLMAPAQGNVAVRGRSLFVGADDGVLHVNNRLSGVQVASLYLGSPIRRSPFVYNGESSRVYVWTSSNDERGGLYAVYAVPATVPFEDTDRFALDVERVEIDWFVPGVKRLVGASEDHFFCTRANSNRILAINRESGELEWYWDIEDDLGHQVTHMTQYVDPTDQVRSIYTTDGNGRIRAYRLFGQPIPQTAEAPAPTTAPAIVDETEF